MLSNNTPILVTGQILFSEELSSFSGATGNVYLEDVSSLDAPSKIVAKQVIPDISHEMGTENRVEFALKGEIAIYAQVIQSAYTSLFMEMNKSIVEITSLWRAIQFLHLDIRIRYRYVYKR